MRDLRRELGLFRVGKGWMMITIMRYRVYIIELRFCFQIPWVWLHPVVLTACSEWFKFILVI
jgi:hypothetical protein